MTRPSIVTSPNMARVSLALLALILPFEAVIITAGPLEISTLELVLVGVLLLALFVVVGERRWQEPNWLRIPRPWLVLWLLFAVMLILSAFSAHEFGANAFKASLRLLSGLGLALAVPQLVRHMQDYLWLVVPLLLSTLITAGLGLLEVAGNTTLPALEIFRTQQTTVGPFVRLTGTFDHANQLAMFLEATLPLWIALGLLARNNGLPARFLLVFAGLIFLESAVLTYSRSAIATIFISNLMVAGLLWFREGRSDKALPWAGLAIGVVLLFAANALFNPVIRMRVLSEDDSEWYDLSFDVPSRLTVSAGETVTTTVTVQNRGLLTWSSAKANQFHLGGHWNLTESNSSLAHAPRWSLPQTVHPGEKVQLKVGLRAPRQSGRYRFQWDMVQENVTWFSYKNGTNAGTTVIVEEGKAPPVADEADAALNEIVEAPSKAAPIPGRRTLWRIAVTEFLEHPLLGIGLDNFRLVYGRALDYADWNESIHTNNWYVEMLVSVGLLGALPFFAWIVLFARDIFHTLRRATLNLWQIALAVAILSYFVHGLLDYFLMFNSTGLLFWLLTGLWVATRQGNLEKGEPATYCNVGL